MKLSAFTLIELLIVIVIIAVLLAILLPVLSVIRQQTNTIICSSNLRQLFLAFKIYEQEKGTLPQGLDDSNFGISQSQWNFPGNPSYDKMGWWWFQAINISVKTFSEKSIICCPSKRVGDFELNENILCGNYGVNRSICKDSPGPAGAIGSEFVGTPLSLNEIPSPSQTLLLVDSGYSLISWHGVSNISSPYFDNPRREGSFYVPGLEFNKQRMLDETISPGCQYDAINGRHPNKTVNVIFADGHSKRLKADSLFVEETGGEYYNRTQLWVPGK